MDYVAAKREPPQLEQPFFSQQYFQDWLKDSSRAFSRWFEEENEYLNRIVKSNHVVMDVGCGFGRHLKKVAPACKEAHGVDNNPAMIKKATERLLPKFENLHLYLAEGKDMPVKSEIFDVVFCLTNTFGNMSSYAYQQRVLNEINRILKPDGQAILSLYSDSDELQKARIKDYEKIGLTIDKVKDGVVYTKEGLVSEQFNKEKLSGLFEETDFDYTFQEIEGFFYICTLKKR